MFVCLFLLSFPFFHPIYHRALIAANNTVLVSGQIPVGYAFAAKEHSEKTHEIPVSGAPGADSSYSGQVIRMNAFLRVRFSLEYTKRFN
jgi:hypothetical protein